MKNVLVTGGTGKTGRKVAVKLTDRGYHVRIGSRKAVPSFDWENPDSWPLAMDGIDMAYVCFQPDLAVPGALEIIKAFTKQAIDSGIKKLVLLSGKGEKEAELCEDVIINSGLSFTIVRATWFSQNFSESFLLQPILAGHVALPKPHALVPYIDTDDISDVVVQSLIDDKHNGQLYELTGPRQLKFEDVVNEISKATDRKIAYTPISMTEYNQFMQEAGVPPAHIWMINYLFEEVLDTPGNEIVTNDVEKVLGRKAKDFSLYARQTAATGVWNQTVPAL